MTTDIAMTLIATAGFRVQVLISSFETLPIQGEPAVYPDHTASRLEALLSKYSCAFISNGDGL